MAFELIFVHCRMSTPPPKQRNTANLANSLRQRELEAALSKMPRNQELLENKVLIPLTLRSNAPAPTLPAVNKVWGGVPASSNNANYKRIFGMSRKSRKSRKSLKSRRSVKGKKSRRL